MNIPENNFSSLGKSIEKFYNNFIIRDVISFILPGLIFITTFAYTLSDHKEIITFMNSLELNWISLITVILACYPIGVSLQFLGITLGVIKEYKNDNKRLYFDSEMKFLKAIASSEPEYHGLLQNNKLYRERLIGLRQMCGNLFVALLFPLASLAISALSNIFNPIYLNDLYLLTYLIIIMLGFHFASNKIIEDQDTWQKSRIDNIKLPPK